MLQQFNLQQPNPYTATSISDLGEQLAYLQRRLNETQKNALILIDGWESSGKGYMLNRLCRELDPRYYTVNLFERPTAEERARPFLWRFFDVMPPYGHMAIFDRSFYYELMSDPELSGKKLTRRLDDILFIERLLVADNTLIVKFFLTHSEDTMRKRIRALEKDPSADFLVGEEDRRQLDDYDRYEKHFDTILEATHFSYAPWHIISTEDRKEAAKLILGTTIAQVKMHLTAPVRVPVNLAASSAEPHAVSQLDLTARIDPDEYDSLLRPLQKEAATLLLDLHKADIPVVVAFEGIDAAGKGGTIQRLTHDMDPRGFAVAPTSAPDANEKRYHYLRRFYNAFPPKGHMAIFDRTWYGRVLVERIEQFTPKERWMAAYDEINAMENSLVDNGMILLKFLLVIDKDEQKRRFDDRAADPDKAYKLTDEDWRNRDKFDIYVEAMDEMVMRTSTEKVPWHVLSSQQKEYARITVLQTFIKAAKKALKND